MDQPEPTIMLGPEGASKQDPEALVLRGKPRPAVRFRRGLMVGAAAAGLAAFAGVAWLALQPPTFRAVAEQSDTERLAKGPPDALSAAPAGYGDVPQLGPPLPGDLGRPILEQQRALEARPAPASGTTAEAQAAAGREAERQRLLAAEQAARSSAVLLQLGRDDRAAAERTSAALDGPGEPSAAPPEPAVAGAAPSAGPGRKLDFTRSSAGNVSSHRLVDAPSPWLLSAGTVIPASLLTGLNSDLPGLVLAQVTEHVCDSITGTTVLIPQGSRLIGTYDSLVAFGQRRALVVWERIILPDGSSVRLDNMPATDAAGFAGVEDTVDFQTWRLLTGVGLATLLGVGSELNLGEDEGDLVRALRESAQQNATRAGDQLTRRNLDVQPTLRVRPGWPVRAIVHKDLVLRPWGGKQ